MSYGEDICKPHEVMEPAGPHHWYAYRRDEDDTWFRCQCGVTRSGEDLYNQPVPEEKDIWPI